MESEFLISKLNLALVSKAHRKRLVPRHTNLDVEINFAASQCHMPEIQLLGSLPEFDRLHKCDRKYSGI